jgi:hypothetical protein
MTRLGYHKCASVKVFVYLIHTNMLGINARKFKIMTLFVVIMYVIIKLRYIVSPCLPQVVDRAPTHKNAIGVQRRILLF